MLVELRRRVLYLTSWNTTGATSYRSQDQCNRDIMLTLALSLDLLYDSFNSTERAAIIANIVDRYLQANPNDAGTVNLMNNPYDSHGANTQGFLAVAAAILVGEHGPAGSWVNSTAGSYFSLYSAWGDEGAGFANSLGYAFFDAYDSPQRWIMLKQATGVDSSSKQFVRNWPLQFIYFSPPFDAYQLGHGDGGEMEYAGYASAVRNRICAAVPSTPLIDWWSSLINPALADWRYGWDLFVNVSKLPTTPMPFPAGEAHSIHLKGAEHCLSPARTLSHSSQSFRLQIRGTLRYTATWAIETGQQCTSELRATAATTTTTQTKTPSLSVTRATPSLSTLERMTTTIPHTIDTGERKRVPKMCASAKFRFHQTSALPEFYSFHSSPLQWMVALARSRSLSTHQPR